MAGSYGHVVDDQGRLLSNEDLLGMLDTSGDVYEAIHEMYGMIWYLADETSDGFNAAGAVEAARRNYRHGLELSPGVLED